VVEVWDSREAWQVWFDGTITPNMPPGAKVEGPIFTELLAEIQPG
jgi:hypothetical protein